MQRHLPKEGAVAVLIGRTGGKLQAVAEEIRKEGGRALVKVCDIAVPEQVEQCFREIEQEAGNVDVLVNNAAYHKSVPVVETSNEEWLSQISINLNGTFFCTKAVLPAMIQNRYGKSSTSVPRPPNISFPDLARTQRQKAES